MTEIQIKNLIKEYEKEYIEFMEIEKFRKYQGILCFMNLRIF